MRLIAIANIVSTSYRTIGFRLLDTDTKQIKDVPSNNVKAVLAEGNIKIDNLEIKEDLIVGSNGSINRLPKIMNGQLAGESPLLVINQLDNYGYTVADFKGTIIALENAKVIKYAKENGIANGKITNKEGKEYISSINGDYTRVTGSNEQTKEKAARLLAKARLLYSNVKILDDGRLLITLNKKQGLISVDGKIIIGPECDTINGLNEDTHAIEINKHWGIIDRQGNIMVKPIYDNVFKTKNGLTKVELNNNYGFVGDNAKEIVAVKYTHARDFSEGLATVNIGDNYGYVDINGNEVIPLQYKDAEKFSEGLAAVTMHNGGKKGFIDKTGKMIIQPIYDGAQVGEHAEFISGKAVVRYNEKAGIIDSSGKIIVQFNYSKVRSFSDGMAAVREYKDPLSRSSNAAYWGFVDATGNEVISLRFGEVLDFNEDLAPFKSLSKMYGLLDKAGNEVIRPIYEEMNEVSEGLIGVCKNKRWGYINKTGKIVIALQYREVNPFKNGVATVKDEYWKRIIIDKTGKEVS